MKHLRYMPAATQHANNPPNEKPMKEEKYFTWRSTSLVLKRISKCEVGVHFSGCYSIIIFVLYLALLVA